MFERKPGKLENERGDALVLKTWPFSVSFAELPQVPFHRCKLDCSLCSHYDFLHCDSGLQFFF